MSCKWNGRNNPRTITGRHEDDCHDDGCPGCQPCLEPHCRICHTTHTTGTCAECLAKTRDRLHRIAKMCRALPAEAVLRGIDSEAMMLWGPSADPEAMGHVEAAYLSGRLPEGWIEATHGRDCPTLINEACTGCAGSNLHPLFILGSWDMQWREALDHDEPKRQLTVAAAVDYLDTQMTYMAGYEHVPFEDFDRDLERCCNHLEAVLHDGEQVDRGAPCMSCNATLERVWDYDDKGDGWRCPRCKQSSSDAQYRFAVMHLHREEAEWLTDQDMQIRTGVKAGTVRVWARREQVRSKRDQGRTVYAVADVEGRIVREESA